jgi:hypothetical protein
MKTHIKRRIATVSEAASKRAKNGWVIRREQMRTKERARPEQYPQRLLGRLVSINELTGQAREICFFQWDNDTQIRRKIRDAAKSIFA